MKQQPYFRLLAATAAMALGAAGQAGAAQQSAQYGTDGLSIAVQAQAIRELHASLAASPRRSQRHTVTLSADDLQVLAEPQTDASGRLRVGVHKRVARSVPSGADLIIRVPGAESLRLELTGVTGTVAVFTHAGEAREYSADGFTHTFSGNEVRVRGSAEVAGVGAINYGSNLCGFNAPCVENAMCVSMPAAIDAVRDAYASMLFVSGRYYYLCSGGLLADSDPSGEIPYFLTANHCISKGRESNSLETFFGYEQTSCTAGGCSLPASASTVGSSIVATNRTGDYTLLRLSQSPPAGSVYLGWNDTPVAFSNGTQLYRISHPGGAPQAYSEHTVDASAPTCGTWPRGQRIYSRDVVGATEGGSSGSPVLNAAAEVVGQLSGACGFNVGNSCDATSNATVDGAFAAYYPEISAFLGGGGPSGCVSDSDCNDSIACTVDTCNSATGQCAHDNSGCSACTAVGAGCSVDSDCCGGKCRGRSGAKQCK